MAISVGGSKSITDEVKAAGGKPGPRSKWLGAWALKSGIGDWDAFFSACKADGVQPLVLWWAWGDDISPSAILNGVQDRYQGVQKNQGNLLPLLDGVMKKAQVAGVAPLIAIENEFNKNGCERSTEFAAWFDKCASAIKADCPAAKVIFAPGNWGDLKALGAFYAPQLGHSDMVGLQAVLFAPRQGVAAIQNVGANLAKGFASLGSRKPAIAYDVALSTYGGNYSTSPPFPGGDGTALEATQAAGIQSLGAAGIDTIVYRDLKDNPTFSTANYGGEAEQYVGVVRADGSKKMAYAALMALAASSTPAPPVPAPFPAHTEAEYQAVVTERDAARAGAADLQHRIDTAMRALSQ